MSDVVRHIGEITERAYYSARVLLLN